MASFLARIILVATLVIGVGFGLSAYMSYTQVRSGYLETLTSRMRMVGSDVAATIETSSAIGIAVSEQTTLPKLLAREAGEIPLLVALQVRLPSGELLFSSRSPDEVLPRSLTVTSTATNDIGEPVASVEVLYDAAAVDAALSALGRRIAFAIFIVFPLALALTYLASLFLVTPLRRFVARPEEAVLASPAGRDLDASFNRLEARLSMAGGSAR